MTITYTAEVANSSWGCFLKLLFRWKGSVYKLLWKELIVFLGLFYFLNFINRFALNEQQKGVFEKIVIYCDSFNNLIPVAFVLGFYVSIVCTRWWEQFKSIPWPDRTAVYVTALLHGHDERPRLMRRTIMRYLVLSFTMTLSSISTSVKKRFPTLDHMREAGLMLEGEQKIIEHLKTPHSKYFVPLVWATSLVTRARKEGLIRDDFAVKTIIDEINRFRSDLGMLYNFDWVNIPMVYTQVVTLAVYTFFLSCLMGRQFLDKTGMENRRPDMYLPLFTTLQFFFYMGWLKVAESLINPFGDDDDDFDINTTIDRNIQVSYLIVDEMHSEFPELIRDAYWDAKEFEMPWTHASARGRTDPHLGSAVDIQVSPKQADFVPLSSIREESPSMNRSQTQDGSDCESQPDKANNKKSRFLRKPKSYRPSNRPISDGDRPQPGGGSVSSVATSVSVPISPTSPEQQGGVEEMFVMTDLDGTGEEASLRSTNSRQKLKEELKVSPSGNQTLNGSAERLMQQDAKDSRDDNASAKDRLIPSESDTSLSRRQKGFAEVPSTLPLKSGSGKEVGNTVV